MAALDLQVIRRVVVAQVAQAKGAVHQVRELCRHRLRGLDVLAEGHGAAHRRAILAVVHVRATILALRQRVPAARQLRGRVEVQLAAHLRDSLIVLGHLLLADRQDDDLVVRQQVLFHRLAEAQVEEHRTVGLLVVHRSQDRVLLRRPILRVLRENTRRRRHVEGLRAADELVAVDLRERALVFARQRRTCRAVGLVADDQVEIAPLIARDLLRAVNDLDRLIRREDDLQALRCIVRVQGVREALAVRRRRDRQVNRRLLGCVVTRRRGHLRIRTHRPRRERAVGLGRPIVQRLLEKRERGDREQDPGGAALLLHELACDRQGRERLTRTARHDHRAAVVLLEARHHSAARTHLMVARNLALAGLRRLRRPQRIRAPIDVRIAQIRQRDARNWDLLALDRILRVLTPRRARRVHDDAAAERLFARCRQERVNVRLLNAVTQRVELALNGHRTLAVVDRDRNQVDARVARAALRPLTPQVDLLELVRETSVMEQELARQLLEQRALLALALRARTILIQQGIQSGLGGCVYRGRGGVV